ncbi:MAG TPA: hypothetical protein VGP93_00610 [Polyangiaceae bacterium]|jgi:hypothetical protein|nr:hypothetical protein [Polyangiaceae bacterium]
MLRSVLTKWPASMGVLVALGATVVGCTADPPDYTVDADAGSTHALVSIERSAQAREPHETRAEAFAGFLQTPPEVDPSAVLKLTGLARELPGEGQCTTGKDHGSVRLAPLRSVELLDVGDLVVNAGRPTTLAPRAFPTVTDLVSGVVYTTRDRDPERLPPAVSYQVQATGGSLGAFTAHADAPAELEAVTLDGTPLSELSILSGRSPLAVSWASGSSGDVLYVEITVDGGQTALLCAYRDDAGSALIPAGLVPSTGHGTIGVHRLRILPFSAESLARAELRFDFEIEADADFQD